MQFPRILLRTFTVHMDETLAWLNQLAKSEKALIRFHGYSGPVTHNVKILQPKPEKFQIKNSDIFHISAQNIDCGYLLEPPRRGGSNEYPRSMFLSRNKKIMYTPANPSFTI